jgi:iron complex outermembrane recepter protein
MQTLLEAEDYSFRDLKRDETDVSPKMALQYFSRHGANYYVSYARGYKSGGFNSISLTGDNLEYEPEEAQTWEGGIRARLFDGKLAVNVTYYQTEFDNLQVLAFNGLLFDVSNAAAAESKGWEGDFQWLTPFEWLKVFGSIGMLDARYVDYPNAPAPISNGIGSKQNLAGREIAFAPDMSATLTPTVTLLFGDFITTLAGDMLYQGAQFTDTDLDPNTFQEAYTKYSARVMLSHAGGSWTLSLGGTNLTDEAVLNQVTDAPFFPGTFFAQQASGRQLFGSLSLAF